MDTEDRSYDVALSFSSDHRSYVSDVATGLTRRGIRVFYDKHFLAHLIGQELIAYLEDVYSRQAATVVAFISEEWVKRPWTTHERRTAIARALLEVSPRRPFFIPFRFDDTIVPGLPPTIAYENLREFNPGERPWERDTRYKDPEHVVELIAEMLSAYGIISSSRRELAGSARATIQQPASGMRCSHAVPSSGTVSDLPPELDLWLVTEQSGSFHPDDGPVLVEEDRWSGTAYIGHHSPRFNTGESFLIHIVAANEAGSLRFRRYLDHAHATGGWPGLVELGQATILSSTRVVRDDQAAGKNSSEGIAGEDDSR